MYEGLGVWVYVELGMDVWGIGVRMYVMDVHVCGVGYGCMEDWVYQHMKDWV